MKSPKQTMLLNSSAWATVLIAHIMCANRLVFEVCVWPWTQSSLGVKISPTPGGTFSTAAAFVHFSISAYFSGQGRSCVSRVQGYKEDHAKSITQCNRVKGYLGT